LQEAAHHYAEKLRTMIEEHRFAGPIRMTASFGVAQFEQGEGVDTLLIRVDTNLYQAKGQAGMLSLGRAAAKSGKLEAIV
jgi:GGDEF domain-containing protein